MRWAEVLKGLSCQPSTSRDVRMVSDLHSKFNEACIPHT